MWIQKLRDVSTATYDWLIQRHPREWSQSHFSVRSKSDIVLNNGCEVFNKTLLEDREKLILNMFTSVYMTFMTRIQKTRDKMVGCHGRLCPKIQKKLDKTSDMSRECILHFSRGPKWQVKCSYGTFVVDLEERTCACRKWDITGIPYMHAVAVIRDCRSQPEDFIDNCYSIETYMGCYNNIVNPINGKLLWPEVDAPTIPPPPQVDHALQGKKQKKRRKQAEEMVVRMKGKAYVKKKGAVTMACSQCGLKGHNKQYHSSANVPIDDWVEVEIQPVENNCNVLVNEQGKLVATRGKGTLSQGRREENQMQFMPTPTVARESPSRILEYGPAATFGR
ncbi:uncharacterized protein LOC111393057 [Olea europaea var. sylvestris]|uniref:uncharacterized protein LOC111393057 n=1 Tax=Olea europaea var. sylvestris TaxID=158386 RepID=UPI000C1D8655|nr:uncharacterized protein LOC111393057 [Olea europaea var. sylvestris]